jgi:16S rRNA G966 N2-methylase RsmD
VTSLAIPDAATFDVALFEAALPRLLAMVEQLDDVGQADEYRAQAAALEAYLAKRGDEARPARALARHLEARIGALLGPPESTNGQPLGDAIKVIPHYFRREFRLLDRYRTVWANDPGRPRERLLHDIKRHRRKVVEADARAIDTFGAEDARGAGFDLLAGKVAERGPDLVAASIDMIVTDPPYGKEYLPLWSELGAMAAKVLKPQGILVALYGQIGLRDVLNVLAEHLADGWDYCQPMPGAHSRILGRQISQCFKLWLGFSNGPWPSGRLNRHDDMLKPAVMTKTHHRWEQPVGPALELIEALCPEGGVVLDPFLGTGTTGVAALQAGRRFIGIEPHAKSLALAAQRLASTPTCPGEAPG